MNYEDMFANSFLLAAQKAANILSLNGEITEDTVYQIADSYGIFLGDNNSSLFKEFIRLMEDFIN